MKIELKKVEHLERCSEETNCYAAQVWVDGKHVADVSNEGHGGCDRQHPAKGFTYKDIEALNQRIAAEYPPALVIDGRNIPADLESVCGDLLTDWLLSRDLKRALARQVLFTTAAAPGIRCISRKQKGRTFPLETLIDHVTREHPDATILNTLPFEAALATYRADGRAA